MNCCGSHNHNNQKNEEGNTSGIEQHSSGGRHGMHWMQFILVGGLAAYILMQFFRK